MIKRINILQVTKRYTKTGKRVNDVTDEEGNVYTVWDPDFQGQLRRGNSIEGEVWYSNWAGKRTMTLRPIRNGSSFSGNFSGNKSGINNDILLYILAVLIKTAKGESIDSNVIDELVNGLKAKFGMV